jgi:hypothetical protein
VHRAALYERRLRAHLDAVGVVRSIRSDERNECVIVVGAVRGQRGAVPVAPRDHSPSSIFCELF